MGTLDFSSDEATLADLAHLIKQLCGESAWRDDGQSTRCGWCRYPYVLSYERPDKVLQNGYDTEERHHAGCPYWAATRLLLRLAPSPTPCSHGGHPKFSTCNEMSQRKEALEQLLEQHIRINAAPAGRERR